MFQLIVAVVGIALIVLLSLVALWLGGFAFTGSNEKALFAQYFNQGTQIEGALKLYNANNGGVPLSVETVEGETQAEQTTRALDKLIENEYLTTAPDRGEWIIKGTSIYRALDEENDQQCRRLNAFVGKSFTEMDASNPDWDGCPPCDDAAYDGWPGCTMADTTP